MTKPERILWKRLQNDQLGFRFRRQFQFEQFILDFYCPAAKLNVEVDGKIHQLRKAADVERDKSLASKGVKVLRFTASAIYSNLDFVVESIEEYLKVAQPDAD